MKHPSNLFALALALAASLLTACGDGDKADLQRQLGETKAANERLERERDDARKALEKETAELKAAENQKAFWQTGVFVAAGGGLVLLFFETALGSSARRAAAQVPTRGN